MSRDIWPFGRKARTNLKGPRGLSATATRNLGRVVAVPFQLVMRPHDEGVGALVEEHLGALKDATLFDRVARLGADGENNALVLPVVEVGGGVTTDADLRVIAGIALDFEFAVPVVNSVVKEKSAAVGIDVNAARIEPLFAGLKAVVGHEFWGEVVGEAEARGQRPSRRPAREAAQECGTGHLERRDGITRQHFVRLPGAAQSFLRRVCQKTSEARPPSMRAQVPGSGTTSTSM